jgi:hypothetical protein
MSTRDALCGTFVRMRTVYVAAACLVFLAATGCSFPSLSKSSTVRFRGDATDPVGDTASAADARIAHPADLVYARVEVTDAALRLTVRFARGSLDSATTGVDFVLDTDLDPGTGGRDLGIGADYLVSLHAGPRRGATVARAVTGPDCATPRVVCRYKPFERADLVLSNDEMEAVIPRSAFGKFDGRLNFRVIAYAYLNGGRETVTSDHMPNLPEQFVAVR